MWGGVGRGVESGVVREGEEKKPHPCIRGSYTCGFDGRAQAA